MAEFEKALGPEHTSTLDTVSNLGSLYQDQGKLGEAEDTYLRALTGYKKALGPEHTLALNTVNNLVCRKEGLPFSRREPKTSTGSSCSMWYGRSADR